MKIKTTNYMVELPNGLIDNIIGDALDMGFFLGVLIISMGIYQLSNDTLSVQVFLYFILFMTLVKLHDKNRDRLERIEAKLK